MSSPALKRRWFSFSLRRMMLALALLSVLFAGGRWWYVRIYHQDAAVWELQRLGCSVNYSGGNYTPSDPKRKSATDFSLWKQFQTEAGRVANRVHVTVPCDSDETAERLNELLHRLPNLRSLQIHTPYYQMPDAAITEAEGRHTALLLRDLPVTDVSLNGERQGAPAAVALARLSNLTNLSGHAMTLTTEELRAIVAKDSLRTIALGPKSLRAESLALLASTEHLENLTLHNPPTADIHLLAKHSRLRITLQFGNATDDDLRAVARLPNLKRLTCWDCPVTEDGVAALRNATSVEEIELAYLFITDRSLESLVDLPHLKRLYCVGSEVTEDGAIAWAKRRPKVSLIVNDHLDQSRIWREVSGARVSFEPPQKVVLERKAARAAKDAAARTPATSKTDLP